MLLALLVSCGLRNATSDSDRERALTDADEAWAARAEPGNLDAAVTAWLGQLALTPDDPQVLARLARGEWTLGQLEHDGAAARLHFELGQDYASRCLLAFPAFAANLQILGFRLQEQAVAVLPAGAAQCMTWELANGLGITEARGPGGHLELEGLSAVSDRLRELDPRRGEAMAAWSAGKVRLLGGQSDSETRALFQEAVTVAPGVLFYRAELAAAFPDERNRVMDGYVPAPAWALENARAAERLSALGVTVGP